ncbi:hypothetical protein [Leptospira stimsonii]|uniref:hypothetical protein n=1 Tax=Leptospira stimsonii TaxID=2202203 RepID=UPI0011C41F32|nr:hypothetical protein [Leptospira stimsonii]
MKKKVTILAEVWILNFAMNATGTGTASVDFEKESYDLGRDWILNFGDERDWNRHRVAFGGF